MVQVKNSCNCELLLTNLAIILFVSQVKLLWCCGCMCFYPGLLVLSSTDTRAHLTKQQATPDARWINVNFHSLFLFLCLAAPLAFKRQLEFFHMQEGLRHKLFPIAPILMRISAWFSHCHSVKQNKKSYFAEKKKWIENIKIELKKHKIKALLRGN